MLLKTKINPNIDWMGPVARTHSAGCIWKTIYIERASINKCHCPFTFYHLSYQSLPRQMVKPASQKSLTHFKKKFKIHTFFSEGAQQSEQFIKYLDIWYHVPARATLKHAEIFTYPSIHRFGCVAKLRGYACAWYRILFSWGISSVFKSDRVLAINDDAVFLGGRAALII